MLNTYQSWIEPYRGKIDAVVQSLGNFKPQELELIATLHFIYYRLKQIGCKEPSKNQVLDEFHRVKKDRFTREEIDSWYDALQHANLI